MLVRPRTKFTMNQKNAISAAVLVVVLCAISPANLSARQTIVPKCSDPVMPVAPQALRDKDFLPVNFPLKSGNKLYMEYDASIVPIGRLFNLEAWRGNLTQIRSVDELSRITGQMNTKGQVLSFVKFFTSEPTRHLLKPNPLLGIEPGDSHAQIPDALSKLLTPTKIDKIDGQWIIERDLLLYPRKETPQQKTPAQLVRSRETISQTGVYTFSIGKVLAEGAEVNNLLPYYD